MKKRAYFITGTDTGVGKTIVTAVIASALGKRGVDVGVMKPVETGCPAAGGELVPEDALFLKSASGSSDRLEDINPYRFALALPPHLAARLSEKEINADRIRSVFAHLLSRHEVLLVEGAGGLLVPLGADESMASLAKSLSAPVIVVAANRLGVINHTLLTVEAALSRGLEVKGVVLNDTIPVNSDRSRAHNPGELKRLLPCPVLGSVPFASSLSGGNRKAAGDVPGGLSSLASSLDLSSF